MGQHTMQKKLSIYDQWIGVRLSKIILIGLIISSLIFGYLYFAGDLNDRWTALYGGLITSLIAVVIQFLMGWNEHREMENFKKMGILKVLPNRDGKEGYYYQILKSATKKIDFLGSTSYSFLRDFGNQNIDAGEKASALTRALKRGVTVRILVIQKEHLRQEKHQKFEEAKVMLSRLKNQYPNLFNYLYLSEEPSHTLVTADTECIVGPIIPGVSSDVTSAIHASTDSPYLKCFLEHFENEWQEAS